MDIKSKNTEVIQRGERRYHWLFKAIAVLTVIFSVFFVARGLGLVGSYGTMDTDRFADSGALAADAVANTIDAWNLFFYYGTEESILQGESSAGRELKRTCEELLQNSEEAVAALEKLMAEAEAEWAAQESQTADQREREVIAQSSQARIEEMQEQIEKEKSNCSQEVAKHQNSVIESARYLKEKFAADSGLCVAYVNASGNCVTNLAGEMTAQQAKEFFEGLPAATYMGTGYYSALPKNAVDVSLAAKNLSVPNAGTFYVGYSAEKYAQMEQEYQQMYSMGKKGPRFIFWGGAAAIGAMCWLCYAAGCSSRRRGVRLIWLDRLYTDIHFCLTVAGIAVCFWILYAVAIPNVSTNHLLQEFAVGRIDDITLLCIYTPILAGTILGLVFILSCARKIKMGVMLRQSLIGAIGSRMLRFFHRIAAGIGGSDMPKKSFYAVMGIAAGEVLCVLLWFVMTGLFEGFGFLVSVTIFILYNLWINARLREYLRDYYQLAEDVGRIGAGELSHRVDESDMNTMRTLAAGINDIAKGLEANLEERVRSERMRTELITNVSHDLRTPLTSMITYVDLLKKEGLDSPRAPEYLDVLDKKSRRLKNLTDDLFEAAKAASGTLPVQISRIDLQALITQGLVELEDRIEQSGLSVFTRFPERRVFAFADGRRLWRALENLLSNALKYSLSGTRVYLEVQQEGERACICVKNVSRDPLGMGTERLMERFVRGDSARHSEGSGLGLSISRSLCELMKGRLELEVDGDLFKATISLLAAPEELKKPEDEPNPQAAGQGQQERDEKQTQCSAGRTAEKE